MAKYLLSDRAAKDIKEIWRYTVSTWSIDQARKYDELIQKGIESLAINPWAGKPYDHVIDGGRRYTVKSHYIFYQIKKNGNILIDRVLHQCRDIEERLKE